MGGMITDESAEKCIDFIRDNASTYAMAKANRVYSEQYRKTVKARLRQESNARTEGQKDDYAYSHVDYNGILDGLKEAVYAETKLQWELEAARVKISAWQTERKANLL